MMRGMYSAISGLRNHQIMLDVTANDLANVNTVGFKASRTSFSDSLAQLQRSGASATTGNAGAKSAQIGLGVQLGSIDNLMTNGAFQSTGGPYDVAITGTGWFRVSNTDPTPGATASTRRRSRPPRRPSTPAPATSRSTTRASSPPRTGGASSARASTPPRATPPPRTSSSRSPPVPPTCRSAPTAPWPTRPRAAAPARPPAFLSLASFPNEAGLDRVSANRWQGTASSGAAVTDTPGNNGLGQTVGGQLEMSNVDLATEFTNMITAQRGFEASSRVLSTS